MTTEADSGQVGARPSRELIKVRPMQIIGPALTAAVAIGLWYFAGEFLMSEGRQFLVPPPHEVFGKSIFDPGIRGELVEGFLITGRAAVVGLAIAIAIGLVTAVIMSQALWMETSLYPFAVLLQTVPILAIVPLIGLLFGFNFTSRVIVTTIIALFPIITNTLFGLKSPDRNQRDLFLLHNASRLQTLMKLHFRAAVPAVFAGFRISAGASVIGAIVGEFFFRQGEPGLGILLDQYRAQLRMNELYGAIFYSAALGLIMFRFFGWLGRRLTKNWIETGQ